MSQLTARLNQATVNYSTFDDTAKAGSDYTATLSQATNATIGDGEATDTIQDNEGTKSIYLPLLAR